MTDAPPVNQPLAGLKVVDMTQMLAGPFCTWMLGALGAEVVKIERPGTGDFTREVAPYSNGQSIYFLSVNRNKRSLTLNLKEPRAKEIFRRLVGKSDILVENNRAGVMDRLGLGWEDLKKVNPRLVYASISGFGQDGPYRHRPCFDAIAQAMSGMMSITGEENGPPARVGASIGDMTASLFAAVGVLAALQRRNVSGEGSFVDVAMLDAQMGLLENAFARFLNAGDVPRRIGSRHPLVAPFQAFETADAPLAVCADTNDQWQRLCKAIGTLELIDDPRFPDGSMRAKNHAALEPLLQAALRRRPRAEWLRILEEADIPSSPINSIPDAIEDPQVRHRGTIVEVGGAGERFVAVPIKLGGASPGPETAAPRLGEHTAEVLGSLGFDAAEIAALTKDGIV